MDQPSANNILTVSDNIFFWCKLFYSRITLKEIDSILKLLSLNDYKNTPVSNLSYGEIKKLELCRLIIERKKLWILDEPFIGLDNKTLEIFNETIKNHAELGGMVIFTSHIKSNVTNIEKMELENDKII